MPPPPPPTLELIGPVRLTGADGADCTPRGQKARGALALLGTAPGLRLNRGRLQDRLWSDRDPQAGADSLRQVLRELRAALGPERDVILTGPGWVGLDPARVTVDLTPRRDRSGASVDFAADLDIRDAEFEDWLRDTRIAFEASATGRTPAPVADDAPALLLVVQTPSGPDPGLTLTASMLLHEAAGHAAELIPGAEVASGTAETGWRLSASVSAVGGAAMALVHLHEPRAGRLAWSQRLRLDPATAVDGAAAAMRLTTSILGAIAGAQAQGQAGPSVWDVFAYDRARLLAADAWLARITDAAGAPAARATALAMRAFLRNTLTLERLAPDPAETVREAAALAAEARAIAPHSALALGVSALVASWQGQRGFAADLAESALRADPSSDFARLALSQVQSDRGMRSESLRSAQLLRAGPLAILGPAAALMRRAMAEIRTGRIADAEATAEAAHAHAPDNRPALRVLAALRHARGDEAGAAEALRLLRAVEPDFSLQLMADPAYPVTSLRASNLLGVTRSGLL